MKRKYFFVFNLFLIVLLTSCATVKVSTVKNNEKKMSDITGYFVYCNIADMELRKSLEVAIVEKFTAKGKKAKESILMFPPIKEYDSLEIKEKCMNNGLNAKLTISPTNTSTETGHMHTHCKIMRQTTHNNSIKFTLIASS